MLKFAEAEDSCSKAKPEFPKVWKREIQSCLDKYSSEMDQNIKEDEADLEKLEENLDNLEFRYYMGEKLREFDLHRVQKSENKAFRVSSSLCSNRIPWLTAAF